MPRSQPRFSSHDTLLDGRVGATLDLHGHTQESARGAVEKFVRANSGKLVHIITGKGKGSAGGPVLRGLVRGMLKGSLAVYVRDHALDAGEGGFRILVR